MTKYFFWMYLDKTKRKKIKIFDQHHGLTPLEKCQFCAFLHRRFRFSERLVCYIKRRKSFFLDLLSGFMTWEYRGYTGLQGVTRVDRGWQGVTGGDKRLHGVTGGYKGLQGVTRGDKGFDRVTKDYRNFFLTSNERSKILFLGLFCIKIKLKKYQIFDENDGLTPLEKC